MGSRASYALTLTGLLMGCAARGLVPSTPVIQKPEAETVGLLKVSSPDFRQNGTIPARCTAYFENQTPKLNWTAGPSGTKSYLVILEDPDALNTNPFVHWIVKDIPSSQLSLPGAGVLGKNQNGDAAYYGPHPPEGLPHHYFFQVFALDLAHLQGQDRDSLTQEISKHVLSKGLLVGTYQKKRHP